MTYRVVPVFHATAALMILLFAVRASVCFAGDPAPTSIRIEYRAPAPHKPPRVEVIGLSPQLIASLRDADFDQTRWNQVLALHVATEDETAILSFDRSCVFGPYNYRNDS
jgi:hypothetical protein